jgi:hypothetical protein
MYKIKLSVITKYKLETIDGGTMFCFTKEFSPIPYQT